MPSETRTCIGCGRPYSDDATLTTMRWQPVFEELATQPIISLVIAAFSGAFTVILWPSPQQPVAYEATGPGVVRWVNYQGQLQVLHESQKGFLKMLAPVCGKQLEVWPKMQANIRYRWNGLRLVW